jgi:hypothetical protein
MAAHDSDSEKAEGRIRPGHQWVSMVAIRQSAGFAHPDRPLVGAVRDVAGSCQPTQAANVASTAG